MRTMLILVLLWSLAQLATAQTRTIAAQQPEGCGTTYYCFVPEYCKFSSSLTDITSSAAVEFKSNEKLFDDCAALIKFHLYGAYWVYVHIESLTADKTHIEFHLTATSNTDIAVFSCEPNTQSGGVDGKYAVNINSNPKLGTKGGQKAGGKTKCVFDAKISRKETVFNDDMKHIYFKISYMDNSGTKQDEFTLHNAQLQARLNIRCDPSYIVFHPPKIFNDKKIFKEVIYEPDNYHCDADFIMEYRTNVNENEEGYEKNAKLTCQANDKYFLLETPTITSPTKITEKTPIDIRCVADAKYFCKDNLKEDADANSGKVKLDRVLLGAGPPGAFELKCPAAYPHVYVAGISWTGKTIECLNYGVVTSWTIEGKLLDDTGPEIHCEKETPCPFKFTDKSVRKGSVGDDRLPKCSRAEDGQLQLNEKNVVPGSIKCDGTSGVYKFSIEGEGGEQIVGDDTIFECKYPKKGPTKGEQQTEANRRVLTYGSIIGVVVAIVLVIGVVVLMGLYARRKYLKEKLARQKKADAINNKAFLKYGVKALDGEPKIILTEVGFVWNQMMMSYKYACKAFMFGGTAMKTSEEGDVGENFEGLAHKYTASKNGKTSTKEGGWPVTKENKELNDVFGSDYASKEKIFAEKKKIEKEAQEKINKEKKEDNEKKNEKKEDNEKKNEKKP